MVQGSYLGQPLCAVLPHQRVGGEHSHVLVVYAADGRPLAACAKHQATPQEERLHQPNHDALLWDSLAQVRRSGKLLVSALLVPSGREPTDAGGASPQQLGS